MKKIISKVLSNAFFVVSGLALVVVVIFCVLLGRADNFYVFGYKPFVIVTGSMEANYMTNSMVVIKKGDYDSVKTGDVIAFRAKAMGDSMAFHRVVAITNDGFVTKGDHNETADALPVGRDNYIGHEVFHTNATAYFLQELHKPGGFVHMVVLPIVAILLIFAAIHIIRNWKADIRIKILAVSGFVLAASVMILLSYILWNSKRVEYINTTLSTLVRQFNGSEASTAVEVNNNKIIGTIRIPAIDIEYPIIKYASPDSLEHAITWFTGADLNQKGNVVLAGNKANGDIFFTNLNRLRKGDEATVVDSSRRKLDYRVVDSFVTDPNDKSVLKQDKTKYELTLISCEKDLNDRYIVKLEAKPTSSN